MKTKDFFLRTVAIAFGAILASMIIFSILRICDEMKRCKKQSHDRV